jgi:hypothetical protein
MADHIGERPREIDGTRSTLSREREAVVLARDAFKRFHVLCFWSFEKDLEITITKIDWVIERLWRHGDGEAWKAAQRLQDLLSR